MIDQGARLAVSRGCDQIPDEAFDVLIPLVVVETVHEDGSADGFYVLLSELTFVAPVRKNVCPPSPTAKQKFSMQTVFFSLDLGLYSHRQAAALGKLGSKVAILYIW